MNINEFFPAIAGAFIGGFLSLGGVFIQSEMVSHKDAAAEKRQKLELMMEYIFKLESCKNNNIIKITTDDECEKDNTIFRIVTISSLYFPNMEPPVEKYVGHILDIKNDIASCQKLNETPNKESAILCAKKILTKNSTSNELSHILSIARSQMEF